MNYISTERGLGAVIAPIEKIAQVVHCGCLLIERAIGKAIVLCPTHEGPCMEIVRTAPVLPGKG